MPPVGFEPTISAGERPKTYAFDRVATGTGVSLTYYHLIPSSGVRKLFCLSSTVDPPPFPHFTVTCHVSWATHDVVTEHL